MGRDREGLFAGKFWVFDLDGTLTKPVHDFALIRASLGVPEGLDILGYLSSLSGEEAQPLNARLDDIERDLVAATSAAPGARELVEALALRGCRLGILTRNSREIALLTLRHIGLAVHFAPEAVLGRNEARPKPDPEGVYLLASLWGTPAEELVMVGDYLYDLQAGRSAGAATIHVHGNRDRRWPECTDLCVGTLDELAQGVERTLHRGR